MLRTSEIPYQKKCCWKHRIAVLSLLPRAIDGVHRVGVWSLQLLGNVCTWNGGAIPRCFYHKQDSHTLCSKTGLHSRHFSRMALPHESLPFWSSFLSVDGWHNFTWSRNSAKVPILLQFSQSLPIHFLHAEIFLFPCLLLMTTKPGEITSKCLLLYVTWGAG